MPKHQMTDNEAIHQARVFRQEAQHFEQLADLAMERGNFYLAHSRYVLASDLWTQGARAIETTADDGMADGYRLASADARQKAHMLIQPKPQREKAHA